MKPITIEDKYRISFYKMNWSDDERVLAKCLDMVDHGEVITADVKLVEANALKGFMDHCFKYLMISDSKASFRKPLFAQIKAMYKAVKQDFLVNYYSKANYDKTLYKHQKDVLSQMLHKKYNLLALEAGLGKTITSATLSKILNIKRTIIIAPNLVKWNWFHNMCDDWGFDPMMWTILDSKKNKCMMAFRERFVVLNYEMVGKYWKHLVSSPAGHIIIDEVHYCRNPLSIRAKLVYDLIRHHKDARVTMLSGTPVTNRVGDLFSYCKMAEHQLGDNHAAFKKQYLNSTGGKWSKVVGSKNLDDLRLKMSNFMIRRKTEDCVDLPSIIIQKYFFELGDLQKEYDELIEQMYNISLTKDEKGNSLSAEGNLHTLNRLVATSKVNPVYELANSLLEQGRKVVIFSGYTDPLTMLEEKFGQGKCVLINGSVGAHKRQKRIDQFKNDPDCGVFLANVVAGGIGINLVNAYDVIFMNFPFTPDLLEQPQKRLHRIGQVKPVNVYYTFGKGTIDEHVFNIVVDKSVDIKALLDTGRKGVIHYGSLPGKIFSSLISKYESEHGIINTNKGFKSVK